MRILRTLVLAVTTLASGLPGCARPIQSTETRTIAAHILSDSRSEAATQAGRLCRDKFEKCTKPENVCIADRNQCMNNTISKLHIEHQTLQH